VRVEEGGEEEEGRYWTYTSILLLCISLAPCFWENEVECEEWVEGEG
jgi:hypothetical protein